MYERFTDRSRTVMKLAESEAERFSHESVGTEHVLLGMVSEGKGVAAHVLKKLGISLKKARSELKRIVAPGAQVVTGKPRHTPRANKVIEYSYEEARNLGHQYVGTEHLLLALLRVTDGVAAQLIKSLGVRLETVRAEILMILGGVDESSGNREQ
jgi:ATP-dependent Clp protease ATP-binding subunit ClpC